MIRRWVLTLIFTLFFTCLGAGASEKLRVGSKKFTESVIIGEIIRLSLENEGFKVEHKKDLGGTRILWNALINGDIDFYAEYTGTLSEEILQKNINDFSEFKEELSRFGIGILPPLGFNNTYAIGMKRSEAEALGISKISDLKNHPDIKIALGEEFRTRRDGWPGLKTRYGLPQQFVRGIDHDIAYRALEGGDIQVMDFYSTDAEIAYYDLLALEDDLKFFPRYEALILYRLDLKNSAPEASRVLSRLSQQISDQEMTRLNRLAKIDQVPSSQVAADFLKSRFGIDSEIKLASTSQRIWLRTKEHLLLVSISLILAIMFAIPLGVFAEKSPGSGKVILWTVGIIQTIPALALLVILIRPLNILGFSGIGDTPALIALFLYALLPIVRSTHSGFQQIPQNLRETTAVLGLRLSTRLFKIELPLALPSILSGIKTSAVINVGFATLGALVGAGGYGQPILTGIRLDNYALILEGSIPAAVLALVIQQGFDLVERKLVSPGLVVKRS